MKIQGKFIGVKEKTNVFVAEKTFTAHAGEKAVLKATALGLYCAHLNGVRVRRLFNPRLDFLQQDVAGARV